MGWRFFKNERQQLDKVLHGVATKEKENTKRMTKHKLAGWHSKEGGNHLEQDSIRQTTVEGTDRGLHPLVDEQRLSEVKCSEALNFTQSIVWFHDKRKRGPFLTTHHLGSRVFVKVQQNMNSGHLQWPRTSAINAIKTVHTCPLYSRSQGNDVESLPPSPPPKKEPHKNLTHAMDSGTIGCMAVYSFKERHQSEGLIHRSYIALSLARGLCQSDCLLPIIGV